jgi:gluconokinase
MTSSPRRATTPRASRGGPLVVAIDVGSSSVRAGLYDLAGRPRRRAFAQVRYAPDTDLRGAVSIDPERLVAVLVEAVDGLVAVAGADLGRVAGVGTSCFLHSVAGLDGAGRPLTPLLTWADTTSADAATDLRGRVDAAATWQATGAPIHASYWPAKIVRLRAAEPGIRGFAGAPELLWRALTGHWGTELSHASGTGLLDRGTGEWHGPLLDVLGVARADLPPILPPATGAPLAGWAAARWPGLAAVPWFAPWSDASCGNVGLGGGPGGPAVLQLGTSGAMRLIADDPAPPIPVGLFAHRLADGRSLVGGQLSEGGGVAAAVARLLGGSPRTLESTAAALPADGHGLTVLPFLAGERGPGYHADARGVVAGLTLATRPVDLYRATVEAITLRFAAIDARLTAFRGDRPEVVASGGAIARSTLLPDLLAAALGRPVTLSAEGEASARGAALGALSAVGLIASPAAVGAPPAARRVEPRPEWAAALAVARERQERLYEAILGES